MSGLQQHGSIRYQGAYLVVKQLGAQQAEFAVSLSRRLRERALPCVLPTSEALPSTVPSSALYQGLAR